MLRGMVPISCLVYSAGLGLPETLPGRGTYAVGEDIAPSVYWTEGVTDTGAECGYWRVTAERRIQHTTRGPAILHVHETDVEFTTVFCRPWVRLR